MTTKRMKYCLIILYTVYMIVIVSPTSKPSVYNAVIGTLETCVTEILCFALIKYHDSIIESQKTILNFLVQAIAATYGGIYFFSWLTSLLFNILPNTGLKWLQSYPSTVCFLLSADIFHFTYFINMILIIILYSLFTIQPRIFIDCDDFHFKTFVSGFNAICLFIILYGKWTVSFCGKSLLYKISKSFGDEILDKDFKIYEEGSKFAIALCILACFAVLLSRLIILIRRKSIPINKYQVNLSADESNTRNNEANSNRNIPTQNNVPQNAMDYNLDTIGLLVLVIIFCFIIFVRHLMNLDLKEDHKILVVSIYDWSNTALERAFGSTLPLYWLLRKEHSRAFVMRKINHFFLNNYDTGRIKNSFSFNIRCTM